MDLRKVLIPVLIIATTCFSQPILQARFAGVNTGLHVSPVLSVAADKANDPKRTGGGVLLGVGIPIMGTGAVFLISTAIRNSNANSNPGVQVYYTDTTPRYVVGGICAGTGLLMTVIGGALLSRAKVAKQVLDSENMQLRVSYDAAHRAAVVHWDYTF